MSRCRYGLGGLWNNYTRPFLEFSGKKLVAVVHPEISLA
jgi:hypothetical protein